MRPELVVELQMVSFAEQVEIEVGQDRWKAIRIIEIDQSVSISGAQVVACCAVGQATGKETGVMQAGQLALRSFIRDHLDAGCVGQEHADNGLIIGDVWPEIMKRVGMAAFDDRVGFRGEVHLHVITPA